MLENYRCKSRNDSYTIGITLAPHWTHDVNVQIGAARPEVMIMEYFEAEADIFNFQLVLENPVIAKDGFITPPSGSGHGLILNQDAVRRYLIE